MFLRRVLAEGPSGEWSSRGVQQKVPGEGSTLRDLLQVPGGTMQEVLARMLSRSTGFVFI